MNKIKIKRKDGVHYISSKLIIRADSKEQFESVLIKEYENALKQEFAYNHAMNNCRQIHISKKNHNKIFTEHKIELHDKYEYYICDNYVQLNKFYNWIFIFKKLSELVFSRYVHHAMQNKEYRKRYFDTLFHQKKYMQYFEYKFNKGSIEYENVTELL
ncbi:hypothetical protein KQI61_06055 [Anaerocolumna aminovalerica]|uniref:hypothetical protein n=1 Tax=Anaerocolumna aminovalerica TaxID=1527 RepID=UPI001C0EC3E7|nr:hypothetical protein [Anaerocolumna aminovalerica]MBU5331754.1 hypothetical protein [Anaerocolumna aminovalerica]